MNFNLLRNPGYRGGTMKTNTLVFSGIVVAFMLFSDMASGDIISKRSRIGLQFGYWSHSGSVDNIEEIDGTLVETDTSSDNLTFGLLYTYWMRDNWAIGGEFSAIRTSTNVAITSYAIIERTTTVASMILSLRYYVPEFSYRSPVRPFLMVGGGPAFATETLSELYGYVYAESRTQTAFCGQFGGGVDVIASRQVMVGFKATYNLMTEYSDPVAGIRDYSGPEISVNIGYLFGRGH